MSSNKVFKSNSDGVTLSERAQILLKTLIEKYIDDGQPVGSKALALDSGLDVSAATIRNVLAELESLGFLRSPHTSSGRVPTDRAFRLFVDSMVTVKPLMQNELDKIEKQFDNAKSTKDMALSVSGLLSGITSMASIVMLPKRAQNAFRHIEFMPLSDNRVLAIIVVNNFEIENRLLHTSRPFKKSELEQVANYLNAQFQGKDIRTVRDNLLKELQQSRQQVNTFMTSLIEMADRIFPQDDDNHLFVSGKTNLLTYQHMGDTEKLRQLFEAFKGKKDMLDILDQCLLSSGVQIYIGSEFGKDMLDQCSLITAPYTVDENVVGILGVIGPTRMNYDKVIPVVDITAKLFGSALQNKQ